MTIEIKNRYTGNVLLTHPGANLRGAYLRGADLRGAYLVGADLRGADLRGANLYGADLEGANLYGANLRGADLGSAYLVGADLGRANLRGADLEGADLRGANGIISGGTPDGWPCYGWLREGVLSIRVGCREKRFDEAVEYWDRPEKKHRQEVVAACLYLKTVAELRGWNIR